MQQRSFRCCCSLSHVWETPTPLLWVDRNDQHTSLYRRRDRKLRWWVPAFWWLVEGCIYNAYVAFKQNVPDSPFAQSYLSFKLELSHKLLTGSPPERQRAPRPAPLTPAAAVEKIHPFPSHAGPIQMPGRRRCIHCDTHTKWGCEGCQQYICYNKCFRAVHTAGWEPLPRKG